MADELQQSIEQNATEPKRVRGDSGEVEQHSLKDQIEADRYLASKKAAAKGMGGIRISKMKASGA